MMYVSIKQDSQVCQLKSNTYVQFTKHKMSQISKQHGRFLKRNLS